MSRYFFVVCEPKTLNLTKKGALLPTYLVVLQHSLFLGEQQEERNEEVLGPEI
jgi:hypothetical protein